MYVIERNRPSTGSPVELADEMDRFTVCVREKAISTKSIIGESFRNFPLFRVFDESFFTLNRDTPFEFYKVSYTTNQSNKNFLPKEFISDSKRLVGTEISFLKVDTDLLTIS